MEITYSLLLYCGFSHPFLPLYVFHNGIYINGWFNFYSNTRTGTLYWFGLIPSSLFKENPRGSKDRSPYSYFLQYIFYVDSLSTVVYVKHALHISYAPNTAYLTENTECQAFYPVIRIGSPTPSPAREFCSFGTKGGRHTLYCTRTNRNKTKQSGMLPPNFRFTSFL